MNCFGLWFDNEQLLGIRCGRYGSDPAYELEARIKDVSQAAFEEIRRRLETNKVWRCAERTRRRASTFDGIVTVDDATTAAQPPRHRVC